MLIIMTTFGQHLENNIAINNIINNGEDYTPTPFIFAEHNEHDL